jgi:hypothetical protein
MKTEEAPPQFAVCIENAGYPASLKLRKIYQVLPDEKAAKHNLVRVIDELGEDYLLSAKNLPLKAETPPRAAASPKRAEELFESARSEFSGIDNETVRRNALNGLEAAKVSPSSQPHFAL